MLGLLQLTTAEKTKHTRGGDFYGQLTYRFFPIFHAVALYWRLIVYPT